MYLIKYRSTPCICPFVVILQRPLTGICLRLYVNSLFKAQNACLRPRERRFEVEKAIGFHLRLSRIVNEREDAFSGAGDEFGSAVDTQGVRALLQHHWAERRRLLVFPMNHGTSNWQSLFKAYLKTELKGLNVPEDVHISNARKSLQKAGDVNHLYHLRRQKDNPQAAYIANLCRNEPDLCKRSRHFVFSYAT